MMPRRNRIIGYTTTGRPIHRIVGAAPPDLETLPTGEDLTTYLSERADEELDELTDALKEAMTSTYGDGDDMDDEKLGRLQTLRGQLDATAAASDSRAEENARRTATASELMSGVTEPPEDTDAGDDPDTTDDVEAPTSEDALVASIGDRLATAMVRSAEVMSAGAGGRDLNKHIRLGDIARHAPGANVPAARPEAVLVASADIPGFTQGGHIANMFGLSKAMWSRARMLPVSRGNGQMVPVASLQRDHRYTLSKNPTHDDIQEVLKAATDLEPVIAAGGWCSPSEISYDLFNLVAEAGMIDLATVGTAERGGLQIPTSPSFADIIADFSDGLWTWTEEDDIDAADADSPRKTCVRVPCPEFLDVRLDCEGLCVTAGNLMDFSYPEAIQNFLRLVFAARAHLTNARIIDLMVNGGTAPDNIGPSVPVDHTALIGDAASSLLQSIELSAIDLRNRYRTDPDQILEVILPEWAVGPFKADLANRTGVDYLGVTNAMIANWLNLKNVRVQFVQDWQVDGVGEIGGTTPVTSWPDTVDYLIYFPGTFVRMNGLSLDLGVVRDSTLNETNDHTAAWMEDCYAIHKPGHESRVVTVGLCTAGETGAANLECVS